ncbi:ORF3 [Myodefec virus RodL3_715]|uniref:ORF3 n=1 Tax=Myodefec virus RodL3_715 TaxID=2929220 RepID=A0A976R8R1_9VIRU|nr:ORF3 [Myodefec virus RodL3_715]
MYLSILLNRSETGSGNPTPRGWWPILDNQTNMNGQSMVNILKKPGKGLQNLLKKWQGPSRHSRVCRRKGQRKLKLRGRKRRHATSKHTDTSSTESSEYSTDSAAFSSSDDSDCDGWEREPLLTPSQSMNWTQFINKLCSGSPVDPATLSPNKE